MIKVENVWHHYGIRPILKNVSLHVEEGELVALMGPNGMGKSTLLALIGGLLSPLKGYVEIDGLKRRSSIEAEKAIRKKMVYLPDRPYLPSNISGREYVLSIGRLYDVEEQRLMEQTDRLLEIFDLDKIGDSTISSYSTGQEKKIGICAALATEAPILVLDEPFSGGLDSSALLALSQILKKLAERKDVTVIMAVPVPELVEPLAHKIAVIANGQIIACDSADGLRQQTGCSGSLLEVLEALVHPKAKSHIDDYLERKSS
ncbi:MAG: ABC transporter ATP-binding protein [Planctomycetota bacterium]